MNTSQLAATLPRVLSAGLRPLIVGAPGIGKTDIMKSTAASLGMDLVLMHPSISDPTDFKGLPFPSADGASAQFLPFGDLLRLVRATRPTLAFLDDVGQAPTAVQAALMQPVHGRQIGEHRIPDCVTFAAATNRRQDRAGVGQLIEPLKSRFDTILNVEADIDGWTDWALNMGLPAECVAFLRWRPELLSKFEPTADISNSPSPRGWHSVAKLLMAQFDSVEVLAGAVGMGAAVEFVSFLRTWQSLPDIAALLADPMRAPLPPESRSDIAYAIAAALAARATMENFSAISVYVGRLADASQNEVAVLIVKDCLKRNPKLATSKAMAAIGARFGNLYA
jgi:hypothetical protein